MIEPIDNTIDRPLTIDQTIAKLQNALRDYIEATYHVSDSALVAERKALLNTVGVIHQQPFIESTPRYQAGQSFGQLSGIAPEVRTFLQELAKRTPNQKPLLFDPPYTHQS